MLKAPTQQDYIGDLPNNHKDQPIKLPLVYRIWIHVYYMETDEYSVTPTPTLNNSWVALYCQTSNTCVTYMYAAIRIVSSVSAW